MKRKVIHIKHMVKLDKAQLIIWLSLWLK